MHFVKYNSIENVTHKKVLQFINSSMYSASEKWVVLQKIHGSNFAIYLNEVGEMIPASRSKMMTMNSNFFDFQKAFDKYTIGLKNIFTELQKDVNHIGKQISIHGELCGGYYPGFKQVGKRIQREVHYSNNTEFVVFDIRIVDDCISEELHTFLNHHHIIEMCNKYMIPVVPILFEGSLQECLEWSSIHNADPSEIWKILGMPNEVDGNIREGHVIKPLNSIFYKKSRVIFKDKNDKFRENSGAKIKLDKIKKEYSDELFQFFETISPMICKNRFNNVSSKFGEYSIRNFGDLLKLMTEDIEEELYKNEGYQKFNDSERADFHKILNKKVSEFFVENKKELF